MARQPQLDRGQNGQEYISSTLMIWAGPTGQAQQNTYVERYNRKVRYEWQDRHIFDSIREAQEITTSCLRTYNHDRPNAGIGGIAPAQKPKLAG